MLREGDRFRAVVDVPVTCLVTYASPFTDGFETVLPTGTVVIVSHDQIEGATAIGCRPEEYRRLEKILIPWRYRAKFWVYRGYYVNIPLAAFGVSLVGSRE